MAEPSAARLPATRISERTERTRRHSLYAHNAVTAFPWGCWRPECAASGSTRKCADGGDRISASTACLLTTWPSETDQTAESAAFRSTWLYVLLTRDARR